jgi:hypothetical protein
LPNLPPSFLIIISFTEMAFWMSFFVLQRRHLGDKITPVLLLFGVLATIAVFLANFDALTALYEWEELLNRGAGLPITEKIIM